jgi:hypothetical protein
MALWPVKHGVFQASFEHTSDPGFPDEAGLTIDVYSRGVNNEWSRPGGRRRAGQRANSSQIDQTAAKI